ncbi:mechanosensitive ion channel family protein, partial [Thermodesulfobacteriota bacterium]
MRTRRHKGRRRRDMIALLQRALARSALVFAALFLFGCFADMAVCQNLSPLDVTSREYDRDPGRISHDPTGDISEEETASIRSLVSDPRTRPFVVKELRGTHARASHDRAIRGVSSEGLMQLISEKRRKSTQVSERLRYVLSGAASAPGEVSRALDLLTEGRGIGRLAELMVGVALLLGIGFAAEFIFRRVTRDFRHGIENAVPSGVPDTLKNLSLRTVLDLLSLGVFNLAIFALISDSFPPGGQSAVLVAATYIPFVIFVRVVIIVLRCLLSPGTAHLRVVPIPDEEARFLFGGLVVLFCFGPAFTRAWNLLLEFNLSEPVILLLYCATGAVQFAILTGMIWLMRRPVAHLIVTAGGDASVPSPLPTFIARHWHTFATLFIVLTFWFWGKTLLLEGKDLVVPVLMSFMAFPISFAVYASVRKLLSIATGQSQLGIHERGAPVSADRDAGSSGYEGESVSSMGAEQGRGVPPADGFSQGKIILLRHIPAILRVVRILIVASVFFWVASLWGVELTLGRAVTGTVLKVFITLLLAYVAWEGTRVIIDRKIQELQPGFDEETDLEQGAGGTRGGTLLTLLRKFLLSFVVCVAVLTALTFLGVDIGPLLAGAGIIGIAVGFGAQTLVRDILSGIFFLIDDAFRIGDYVDTGGAKGVVEHISLRSFRLRHHRGMVHTIP